MKRLVVVPALSLLVACGADTTPLEVGEVGWTFNYNNWTRAGTSSPDTDDLRECDNQPASGAGLEPYHEVKKVRIYLEDLEGTTRGLDREYDCKSGYGDKRLGLVGVQKKIYKLLLEAKNAGGVTLYSYTEEELDLTQKVSETYELMAATGELRFTPTYSGSFDCNNNVTKFRYALYLKEASGFAATAAVSGEVTACDGGLNAELLIRNIPIDMENGSQTRYQLRVEAIDASSNVLFCKAEERPVLPSDANATTNLSLGQGACL